MAGGLQSPDGQRFRGGRSFKPMSEINVTPFVDVMLVLLVPLGAGLADVLLMEAALLGWAFASMIGISAVSVASAGTMFRVPMEQLSFGANLKYVAAFGIAATAALMAANRFIFAG